MNGGLKARQAIVFLGFFLFCVAAQAHPSGGPAVAWPQVPQGVGVIAESTYELSWTDSDLPLATGTAAIDLYYTGQMPVTYELGERPFDLVGTPIVQDIKEADFDNHYVWDVSGVPTGSYFIWTEVREPPNEMSIINIIAFAPGVLTVHHPPDPMPPALFFREPSHPFLQPDLELELVIDVFVPVGTATVTVDGFPLDSPSDRLPIATRTATGSGALSVVWDTSTLADGPYGLVTAMHDDRGFDFEAYSRFKVTVKHVEDTMDAGVEVDAGRPDASALTDASAPSDSGIVKGPAMDGEDSGCDCRTSGRPARDTPWLILGLAVVLLIRRSGRTDRGAHPAHPAA